MRQPLNEGVGRGQLRRTDNVVIRRIEVAEPDIVGYRSRKEMGILQHDGEQPAQVVPRNTFDAHPVDGYFARRDIVKPRQHIEYRRLAGPGSSHEPYPFAETYVHRHMLQHRLAGFVRETDVLHADVAPGGSHAHRLRHIRGLGGLVHNLENAFGTGNGRLNIVVERCDIRNGASELPRILQKHGQTSYIESPVNGEQRPHYRDDHEI